MLDSYIGESMLSIISINYGSTDPGKIKQDDECLKQHILKILTL